MLKVVAQMQDEPLAEYTAYVKKVGDIGTAVLDSWKYKGDHLTVLEVYESLEKLMAISGSGSQEEKAHHLTELLKKVDALSASFIIRIILGTMRLGFSDMTLLDALSWMETGDKKLKPFLEHGYNVRADIGPIAYELKHSGIEPIKHMEPVIGIPIRPAAAERAENPQAIIDRLGPCVAQPKLDGFRLQIHIEHDAKEPKIWFYSRNLQDMSSMFPDLVDALKKLK